LLVGIALSILLIIVGAPYNRLIARDYPQADADRQLGVKLALASPDHVEASSFLDKAKDVQVRIPVKVSGIASGSLARIQGAKLTITSHDGTQWSSGWKQNVELLLPSSEHADLDFEMPHDTFTRLRTADATAGLELAIKLFREGTTEHAIASADDFRVPNVGICSLKQRNFLGAVLYCRFAVNGPELVLLRGKASEHACSTGDTSGGGLEFYDWTGNSGAGPFSPIGTLQFSLWRFERSLKTQTNFEIYPGAPVDFVFPEQTQQYTLRLHKENFHLADYRLGDKFQLSVR